MYLKVFGIFPHVLELLTGNILFWNVHQIRGLITITTKVLLALVDHEYNFTCIDIGSYGSNCDAGIFAKSSLKKALEENKLDMPHESVILGDEAFPLQLI